MNLDTALTLLSETPAAPLDLAELALLIARDEYASLDVEAELGELGAMAHELRPRLRGPLTSRVAALSRYLFVEQGFEGDQRDYYDPRNSYLNEVLIRRVGLPISLSLLAAGVAGRAGLEVTGVGLPGHFVARASLGDEQVIFDPFNGGRILTLRQCEELVEQVVGTTFEATPEALEAVTAGQVALRVLSNLKGAYLRRRDFARAARVIGRLRQLTPEDVTQRRDLGVSLLQAGRAGRAIDELAAYLDAEPMDADAVRDMLGEARREVAKWN
jgi:regulator of sirC expression with transglutaminase-like and TPR domain